MPEPDMLYIFYMLYAGIFFIPDKTPCANKLLLRLPALPENSGSAGLFF